MKRDSDDFVEAVKACGERLPRLTDYQGPRDVAEACKGSIHKINATMLCSAQMMLHDISCILDKHRDGPEWVSDLAFLVEMERACQKDMVEAISTICERDGDVAAIRARETADRVMATLDSMRTIRAMDAKEGELDASKADKVLQNILMFRPGNPETKH